MSISEIMIPGSIIVALIFWCTYIGFRVYFDYRSFYKQKG